MQSEEAKSNWLDVSEDELREYQREKEAMWDGEDRQSIREELEFLAYIRSKRRPEVPLLARESPRPKGFGRRVTRQHKTRQVKL